MSRGSCEVDLSANRCASDDLAMCKRVDDRVESVEIVMVRCRMASTLRWSGAKSTAQSTHAERPAERPGIRWAPGRGDLSRDAIPTILLPSGREADPHSTRFFHRTNTLQKFRAGRALLFFFFWRQKQSAWLKLS
ncbi:hypothetical protein L1887_59218 [Cichorium endivia]|nr:hypothetical protein L1887_59218 [Cichorium endivia]